MVREVGEEEVEKVRRIGGSGSGESYRRESRGIERK